jgi:hypothetical protein
MTNKKTLITISMILWILSFIGWSTIIILYEGLMNDIGIGMVIISFVMIAIDIYKLKTPKN